VEDLMRRLEREEAEKTRAKTRAWDIASLLKAVSRETGAREEALCGTGRGSAVCRAREGLAYVWVERLGQSGRKLAEVLTIRPESVYKAAKRGMADKERWEKLAGLN